MIVFGFDVSFDGVGASWVLNGFDGGGCFILGASNRRVLASWRYGYDAMGFVFLHCFLYLISNVNY